MVAKKEYKIVIADISPIICEGIASLIKKIDGFTVIGQIDSMSRLMERLPYFRPNILIINPLLIDFSKRFMLLSLFEDYPHLTLIALHYNHLEKNVLKQYHGVLTLEDNHQRIESILKTALQLNNDNSRQKADNYELSKREIDVLILVAKGMINKEIADYLNISIHTVFSHRKNIIRKTGIKSVSGLTVYALLNKLINQEDIQ